MRFLIASRRNDQRLGVLLFGRGKEHAYENGNEDSEEERSRDESATCRVNIVPSEKLPYPTGTQHEAAVYCRPPLLEEVVGRMPWDMA